MLAVVVVIGCLGVVGWNAASGVAVTDRLLHGKIRKEFDAGDRLDKCFEHRIERLVPPGSRIHLDMPTMPVVALRLTEVMYPRGFVVPGDDPADYKLSAVVAPAEPNCDGIALHLSALR